MRLRRSDGRTGLSKQIKEALIRKYGCRCFIYSEEMPESSLQLDHRVPFEVGGESETMNPDDFMLLSGSANRAKSWSCEHCENWKDMKDREVCLSCYWAFPENHTHVGMRQLRRVDLIWQGAEVGHYDRLKSDAAKRPLGHSRVCQEGAAVRSLKETAFRRPQRRKGVFAVAGVGGASSMARLYAACI